MTALSAAIHIHVKQVRSEGVRRQAGEDGESSLESHSPQSAELGLLAAPVVLRHQAEEVQIWRAEVSDALDSPASRVSKEESTEQLSTWPSEVRRYS